MLKRGYSPFLLFHHSSVPLPGKEIESSSCNTLGHYFMEIFALSVCITFIMVTVD